MKTTKKILGLDLGTNSIGWALVDLDFEEKSGKILGLGSRIIPMSQDILGDFGKGNTVSQTAARTGFRSARRIRERYLLRRERLHRVLQVMDFLPVHYADQIDFEKRLGKFHADTEPKIAYNEGQFIFKASFDEMLADFRQVQPQLLVNKKGEPALIPYDWTIYYLRKKALSGKVSKQELAWILLHFNQKRGYYQLRGEDDEDATRTAQTRVYFDTQVIEEITDTGEVYKGLKVIRIRLANGDTGKYFSREMPDWVGIKKNIIVTVDLDKAGNDRYEEDGSLRRKFSIPTEDDWDKKWQLVKIKTEKEIRDSQKTVGTYIYDHLLQQPGQKIRGKLVRTIERAFYKEELKQILRKQIALQPELFDEAIYHDCVRELYRNNEAHQAQLGKRDFEHLFVEDIIFYQRPLRSQKSSIGNCSLECRKYKDKNGKDCIQYLKVIPKSHPYYQEFRIWQWLYNLSIYRKDDDTNVTADFLGSINARERLFDFLYARKEVEEKAVLKYLLEQQGFKGKVLNAAIEGYRWNYVTDKKYPCNETGYLIHARLEQLMDVPDDFLTSTTELQLWHMIYSVTDKKEYEKALKTFAGKHGLDEKGFVDAFKKFPPFKNEYGSFSEKAIKKLLPLMRTGRHWAWERIDNVSQQRIDKILTGEYDAAIRDRVREKAKALATESDFQGLPLWLAQYLVYGRHSEAAVADRWGIDDLVQYLKDFRQHSLRNPIVEQVITETLRVVKDIWNRYGNGAAGFFDEIHIELGRDMKHTAEERKRQHEQITENENTNLRIKALLAEMMHDEAVENVRPHSPMQQEILKIYEAGVLNAGIQIEDEILKISKTAQPSAADLRRYKLWLEQKYRSPYTGDVIPLNRLFTPDYEIEHIIPQSRYFDDSLSNKVICEAAVNKEKDNQLGYEFIKNHHGQIIECGYGKKVRVFEVAEYEAFVRQHYGKHFGKRAKLLMEDIPEKMIERQMNDTRYISKFISALLSNIVRTETNDDGINAKNLIPGNGRITTLLKQDWGLNDVWNELILPRFERMNQLTQSTGFTAWNEKYQKYLPTVPLELSKGFSRKRIDHRHHAMDALVIACATRDHINLLNNQSAQSEKKRYDLQYLLRSRAPYFNTKEGRQKDAFKEFFKPWETFTQDAKAALEKVVISFKQNLRVINKATNYYEKWVEADGLKEKKLVKQTGVNWAIRKSLHKDTVSGQVHLQGMKLPKGKMLTATRKTLDTTFDIKAIDSITDTGIRKILRNYLASKGNMPELAFSPEGLEELNRNIVQYNEGKHHQPIYKVRVFETGSKFALGEKGNRKYKFVEAAKGTNLFFAVYEDKNGKRNFETISLDEVIAHQKWKATLPVAIREQMPDIPVRQEKGKFLFYLSPNDLVYVPAAEDQVTAGIITTASLNDLPAASIYKTVSFSGNQAFFLRQDIAASIVNKLEFSSANKMERAWDGTMIKECCIKIAVDRLGNISIPKL